MASDSTAPVSGGDSAELMYVRCATCRSWMDVKPGQSSAVTHSICPRCLEDELRKLDRGEHPV